MTTHVFRLPPGKDLKQEIMQFAKDQHIEAGVILTTVGGLQKAVLRMAGATPDKQEIRTFDEKFEVVSLVGTLSQRDCHLHLSISRADGSVIGGHLKNGCIVAPTMEIAIGEVPNNIFTTEMDPATGFTELCVKEV